VIRSIRYQIRIDLISNFIKNSKTIDNDNMYYYHLLNFTDILLKGDCITLYNNNKEPIEANNPLIAVYGIYKNEQNFIERFLESC